jgi:hypothetical protein
MGIFDKVKKTTIVSRRYEEKLYGVALEEVEYNFGTPKYMRTYLEDGTVAD